jgi:hypothetical protein
MEREFISILKGVIISLRLEGWARSSQVPQGLGYRLDSQEGEEHFRGTECSRALELGYRCVVYLGN